MTPTSSASSTATPPDAAQRIDALERRLAEVEARAPTPVVVAPVVVASSPVAPPPPQVEATALSLGNRDVQFQLHPVLQLDGRLFVQGGTNTFVARRVRPTIDATLYDYFALRIMPDFGGSAPTIPEAWGEVRLHPELNVRFGKFKAPVGLERQQNDADLHFIERALPSALAPDRDIGVMIWGDVLRGTLAYAVAFVDGVADGQQETTDNDDKKDLDGRLFIRPFATTAIAALDHLGVGVGVSTGIHHGALPTYLTDGQLTFFGFTSAALANGRETRLMPQAFWFVGPLGLLAEYVRNTEAIGLAGATSNVHLQAWTVEGSVVLTGEKATFGSVAPAHRFDPAHGTWGAVELVARIGGFVADQATFDAGFADATKVARKAFEWSVGAQWHFAPAVKLVVDLFQTTFDGGAASGNDREAETLVTTRFQVAY